MSAAENDADFRALAVELLEEFGTEADLVVRTGGTYDAATGTITGETTKTYRDVLATPPVPAAEVHASRDVRLEGECVSFLAASTAPVEPRPEMQVTLGGESWTVLEVRTYRSGALPAAYELGLRRG